MEQDICLEAGGIMLSFIAEDGEFEVEGSKITVKASSGYNKAKRDELGGIIGSLQPRKFVVRYTDNAIGVEALDPSLQTLEDLLAKLIERLKTE